MGQNPKPDYGVQFPLWIIACSLLLIAVCLVWDHVRDRRAPPESTSAPVAEVSAPVSAADNLRPIPPRPRRAPRSEERKSPPLHEEPVAVQVNDPVSLDAVSVVERQPVSADPPGGYP